MQNVKTFVPYFKPVSGMIEAAFSDRSLVSLNNSSIASRGQRELLHLMSAAQLGLAAVKPPRSLSTSPSSFCDISSEVVVITFF